MGSLLKLLLLDRDAGELLRDPETISLSLFIAEEAIWLAIAGNPPKGADIILDVWGLKDGTVGKRGKGGCLHKPNISVGGVLVGGSEVGVLEAPGLGNLKLVNTAWGADE